MQMSINLFLLRFDGKFELMKKDQELRIENSSPRDQGNYTCVALANDGSVSISRSIQVRKHGGISSESATTNFLSLNRLE